MTYEESHILALAALADPTRRRVLELLASGPMPVRGIASQLPVSRPAVSQHLKVLNDAGLVCVQPEGTRRLYSVRPQGLAPLRDYLNRLWGDVLTNFAAEIENSNEVEND